MKAKLTSIARLKAYEPITYTFYQGDGARVVTNWSATRVFSYDGKLLLKERFHTKNSGPTVTHNKVIAEFKFAQEMAKATNQDTYHGD